MECGEPGSSDQQELMDVFRHEKDDMTLMLLEKISSLEAKVNVNRSEFQEMMNGVTKFSFSRRLVEVKAPTKYTTPKVKEYKRDSDSYEYVCHFKQKMLTVSILMEKIEAMKCKTFTQGLAGPALLWFDQLLSGSINGYNELIRKFISKFSINVKVSKTVDGLFTIKQRNGEALRSYIER